MRAECALVINLSLPARLFSASGPHDPKQAVESEFWHPEKLPSEMGLSRLEDDRANQHRWQELRPGFSWDAVVVGVVSHHSKPLEDVAPALYQCLSVGVFLSVFKSLSVSD